MKTWNTVDKSEWVRGEWDGEPDKAHWVDPETNLDCLIVRGPTGALCGYVGVPDGHKMYESEYEGIEVDVHGGLTFSDHCQPGDDDSSGVCNPKDGASNDNVWWLGFDCAHAGDFIPARPPIILIESAYKNFDYVKSEVESLAKQMVA